MWLSFISSSYDKVLDNWAICTQRRKRALYEGDRNKEISAIVRVQNEGQFLYPAVKSIVDYVDEVVIVDNLSTDNTPAIIQALKEEYSGKVLCYVYKHKIAKIGTENMKLAQNIFRRRFSPHLLANYYNWCLKKCTKEYIVKWDGDMIATESVYSFLEQWKQGDKEVLWIRGANIHPDFQHLVVQGELRDVVAKLPRSTTLPNWMSPYTDYEPRVFPKLRARYDCGFWWCERLQSRFLAERYRYQPEGISYLHLKYCKKDPYSNFSQEFGEVISKIESGPSITPELAATISRWGIG